MLLIWAVLVKLSVSAKSQKTFKLSICIERERTLKLKTKSNAPVNCSECARGRAHSDAEDRGSATRSKARSCWGVRWLQGLPLSTLLRVADPRSVPGAAFGFL